MPFVTWFLTDSMCGVVTRRVDNKREAAVPLGTRIRTIVRAAGSNGLKQIQTN